MCVTGKHEYESKRDAQAFVNLRAGQLNKEGYLRAYPCQLCNKWHVTKQHNQHDSQRKFITLKYYKQFQKYLQ